MGGTTAAVYNALYPGENVLVEFIDYTLENLSLYNSDVSIINAKVINAVTDQSVVKNIKFKNITVYQKDQVIEMIKLISFPKNQISNIEANDFINANILRVD